MKIAVEGCAHGELENIYKSIAGIEKRDNIKVELLICCGDFQSTRNVADLQTMAVPNKFKEMGSFYKYYSGELIAPFLTIFIGGNHEASNYLQELPYGGWVAPNIYYLGYAGVIQVNGVRIAGISGIYKGHDFLRGRYEFSPYSQSSIRSVYHVRQLDVFRLKQLSGNIDIFLSHDWPRGIYNYGNKEQLIRFKPHFRDEIFSNQLGSRPCEDLLQTLKPAMWFAAHLHCQFTAKVPHFDYDDDESGLHEGSNDDDSVLEGKSDKPPRCTEFLALDKCLPRRRFLQIMDININTDSDSFDGPLKLEYDLEWLTILYQTNHLVSVKNATYYMPGPRSGSDERYIFTPTAEEMNNVRKKFNNDLRIPDNFCYTVPAYDPKQGNNFAYTPQPKPQINPQSTQFCDTLGIDDPLSLAMVIGGHELNHSTVLDNSASSSFNESSTSFTSDLNSSVNRWEISTCSEESPVQRKINLSINLPTPIKSHSRDSSLFMTPAKATNPDEVELNNSDKDDDDNKQCTESKSEVEQNAASCETTVNLKRRNQCIYNADDSSEAQTSEKAIDSIATTELNESEASKGNGKSPAKVFKRRNQNIYADNAEDEDKSS